MAPMTKTADGAKRQRFSPAERERLIVDGAIQFFAEVGFAGQTRELALRLSISQPLLYRYFPTKQDLIERVYDEVFIGRWKNEWERLITDRATPLRERLIGFYEAYASEALTYEWIRIYMFAGLSGEDINRRYIELLEQRLLIPVCTEVRAAAGAPGPDAVPISELEIEAAWNIHAAIFYYFVRKFIYRTPVAPDLSTYISDTVDRTLDGALSVTRETVGKAKPRAA